MYVCVCACCLTVKMLMACMYFSKIGSPLTVYEMQVIMINEWWIDGGKKTGLVTSNPEAFGGLAKNLFYHSQSKKKNIKLHQNE